MSIATPAAAGAAAPDEIPGAAAPGPRDPAPRDWGVVRWILVVLGALGVSAGVYYWNAQRVAKATIAHHRAKFEVERRALAAKDRGRPALLEPAEAGSAEDVRAAFLAALAALPVEDRDGVVGAWDPAPEPEQLEEEDRVLAAHPGVFDPLDPMLHVPSRPTLPAVALVDQAAMASLRQVQRGARWLLAATHRAVARGDRDETIRLALLLYVLGADVARSGPCVSWLVGNGIADRALEPARTVLAAGPLTASAAGSLARVLDGCDAARLTLADVLDFERASFRGSWSVFEGDYAAHVGWRHLWSFRLYLADTLDAWDGVADRMREIAIEGAADPVKARDDAMRLDAAQGEASLVRMMTIVLPMIVGRDAKHRAATRVARTAVAIAAYRAEKGTLPATLADLLPTFLLSIPIDPWDGKPLRWSPGAAKGTLWSIGSDGKDDGGIPCGELETDQETGDVSWSIWNGR